MWFTHLNNYSRARNGAKVDSTDQFDQSIVEDRSKCDGWDLYGNSRLTGAESEMMSSRRAQGHGTNVVGCCGAKIPAADVHDKWWCGVRGTTLDLEPGLGWTDPRVIEHFETLGLDTEIATKGGNKSFSFSIRISLIMFVAPTDSTPEEVLAKFSSKGSSPTDSGV